MRAACMGLPATQTRRLPRVAIPDQAAARAAPVIVHSDAAACRAPPIMPDHDSAASRARKLEMPAVADASADVAITRSWAFAAAMFIFSNSIRSCSANDAPVRNVMPNPDTMDATFSAPSATAPVTMAEVAPGNALVSSVRTSAILPTPSSPAITAGARASPMLTRNAFIDPPVASATFFIVPNCALIRSRSDACLSSFSFMAAMPELPAFIIASSASATSLSLPKIFSITVLRCWSDKFLIFINSSTMCEIPAKFPFASTKFNLMPVPASSALALPTFFLSTDPRMILL